MYGKMNRVVATSADANLLQGDYGETWVAVIAAACGIQHGRPTTLDLDKADVLLCLLATVAGTYHPSVLAQVKTLQDLRYDEASAEYVYDLDVKTYNVLRRTDTSFRRVLVVIEVPDADSTRVRLERDGTTLLGIGAWVSIEGAPETTNTTTIAVRLPAANTLDPSGLRRMLETFGVNRSTPVPEVDPWKEATA